MGAASSTGAADTRERRAIEAIVKRMMSVNEVVRSWGIAVSFTEL